MSIKVLSIGSDRKLFEDGSPVSERIKEYGSLVEELHIIVYSDASHGLKQTKLASNIWLYPTSSLIKYLRPFDAIRIGKGISADIITTQDPFECGWAGMRLKEIKGLPLEVQLHTDLKSQDLVRRFIAKKVIKRADGIRDVATLPIYVDRRRIVGEPKFDLHEKYGFKRVVLAVSRLSPEKDIGLAIKAVSRVPDAGLVVVGDGPERKKFEETDRVKFAGWQEDLASYYKTADVFIQTSKFEGYGLSLVEAGLSGLPVVSTPVGIAKELKNVRIARTAEEFAEALKSVLERRPSGLKEELEQRLLSKEEYLRRIKENWENLARK